MNTSNIRTNLSEDELKKFIKEEVKNAYAVYNEEGEAFRVDIEPRKEVRIWFDTERPYLDRNFWKFLGDVAKRVDERLKQEGYVYRKVEGFYDFLISHYSYVGKEKSE